MPAAEEELGTRGQIEAEVPRAKRRPREEAQAHARSNLGVGTHAERPEECHCRADGSIDKVNQ